MKIFRLSTFAAFFLLITCPAVLACLDYEPRSVTLSGVLTQEVFPGRPNYSSIADGDEAEYAWILKLDEPICVNESDILNVREDNVTEVHLAPGKADSTALKSLKGRKISASGKLFHSHTGHHHRPILMSVDTVK